MKRKKLLKLSGELYVSAKIVILYTHVYVIYSGN